MKTSILSTLATMTLCAAALANPADPQISNFSVSQNASRVVHVAYTLDEPAYVTIDVLTNGVSIGGENIQNLVGDVNKLVPAGSHGIDWYAHRSWPGWRFDDPTVSVQIKAWAESAPPDVMDIDLQTKVITYYPGMDFLPDGGLVNDKYRTTHLVMKRVHAAGQTFKMGSPENESNRDTWETQHDVRFTKDYYLAIYETTRRQHILLGAPEPNFGTAGTPYGDDDPDQCPQDRITYDRLRGSVSGGIDWPTTGSTVGGYLATIRSTIGLALDLPTEAQWEFACRAGTSTIMYNGNTTSDDNINETAWWHYNSDTGTKIHAVGGKKPNPWGFYDMYGNIREWCLDWGVSFTSDSVVDPHGPTSATSGRVRRSSDYTCGRTQMRSAFRTWNNPANADAKFGYRLCLPLD